MTKKKSMKQKVSQESLLERLNEIRENEKKTFRRRQMIADALIKTLNKKGDFLCCPDGQTYYFCKGESKVYDIDTEGKAFHKLMYHLARFNPGDTDWNYVLHDIYGHAAANGKEANVWQFCRWQDDKLYLSRFDGTMYVLDGKKVLKRNNGTDGVLFRDRVDWEPWTRKNRKRGFSLGNFLDRVNFDARDTGDCVLTVEDYRQLLKTCMLSLFFDELLPTRPLVLFWGDVGSGKTSTMRLVGQLLFGRGFDVKTFERKKEDSFSVLVQWNHLVALDNVDSRVRWLEDCLSTVSTGADIYKRELWSTNGEHKISPRCFVWLSSHTPKFRRKDVADRLVILRTKRLAQNLPDEALRREIAQNRDYLLGELVQLLNRIVRQIREHGLGKSSVAFRMADFANLGKTIWAALDSDKAKNWDKILENMSVTQKDFALEDDTLVPVMEAWLEDDDEKGPISPSDLLNELREVATESKLSFNLSTATALGKYLSKKKSVLESRLGITIMEVPGRGNKTLRTFVKVNG